ncbi:MAG: hypothetical protein QXH34_08160, partial [Ignisphaera sp.]
ACLMTESIIWQGSVDIHKIARNLGYDLPKLVKHLKEMKYICPDLYSFFERYIEDFSLYVTRPNVSKEPPPHIEEVREIIIEKIEKEYRRKPAKKRVAYELLNLAERGVKSPRGGLWSLWVRTPHYNNYVTYWYRHARDVLGSIPELARVLGL